MSAKYVFYCFLLTARLTCSVSAPAAACNDIMALYKFCIIILIVIIQNKFD